MTDSPFGQLLDSFDREDFGNRVAGLRYAEVESIGEDGYILKWLTSDADAPSAPARCAAMMAGNERGSYFMPEPGDEVLVGFEGGDLDRPVIIGALWSDVDAPPPTVDTSKSNNIRSIVSRLGHQLTFDDTQGAGKVTLQSAGGIKLEMDDQQKKVTLQLNEGTKIELAEAGVTVNGQTINLN